MEIFYFFHLYYNSKLNLEEDLNAYLIKATNKHMKNVKALTQLSG